MIAGCSHGTVSQLPAAPTPTTPVATAPTVRRLIVTPTGGATLIAGSSAVITTAGEPPAGGALGALAQYTDNSLRYVEATWTTSNPNVVVVSGLTLRGIARGVATLTATAEGLTASETFVVEPGIPGTWTGSVVVDQCEAGSGSMQELICSAFPGRTPGLLPPGSSTPISFQMTQSGTDLTAIASLSQIRGTLTGSDRGDNYLTLKGDLFIDRTRVSVTHWDSRVKVDAMEGFVAFEVRVDGIPSLANVTAHLVGVTRR
jgi:hypothetical protein